MLKLLRSPARPARKLLLRSCRDHGRDSGFRLQRPWASPPTKCRTHPLSISAARLHPETTAAEVENESREHAQQPLAPRKARKLPRLCPGCGSPTQSVDSTAAGFYSEKSTPVRHQRQLDENAIFEDALRRGAIQVEGSDDVATASSQPPPVEETPICDRCHYLRHQSTGVPIIHPSVDSIRSIIEESPHKQNHIYHVLDAADFPMSLIPNLQSALRLPRLRTQNRRSKSVRYTRGRVAEVSFIITRSDLLAPEKDQVDRLLPYMQGVLRDALGRTGKNVRLGNVRLVSSKRGWWSRKVKEEIWERGGAGWMVGKVNVGKSALVEVVFPKGRMEEDINIDKLRREATQRARDDNVAELARRAGGGSAWPPSAGDLAEKPVDVADQSQLESWQETELSVDGQRVDDSGDEDNFFFDESENSLLPPAHPEVQYPTMPLVSALPGTTASPIRLPFGGGRGELIDLPGIQRGALDGFVKDEHRKDLVMRYRVAPEQQSVKPGQSLLLGGLIRITPKTHELVFLTYGFLPPALRPHVTSTDKAVAIQTGAFRDSGEPYAGNVPSCATDAARASIRSAGSFQLRWDVTKARTGALTDKTAGKQRAADLPFAVRSLDVLVESVGWVEVVAQTRKRRRDAEQRQQQQQQQPADPLMQRWGDDGPVAREGEVEEWEEPDVPEIEIFSPEGKFVAVRRPMGAWVLGGPKKPPVHLRRARGRQTVSRWKRMEGGRVGSQRKQREAAEGTS